MTHFGLINDDTPPYILEHYNQYVNGFLDNDESAELIGIADLFISSDLDEENINPQEAIRLFALAAEHGTVYGYECIGMMYYNGKYVPKNYETAFKYFEKQNGNKAFSTLYALGEMYRLGVYVEKDITKACECYSKITSVEGKGFEYDIYYWRAFYRLACAKHRGEGTQKDLNEALTLIKKAKRLFRKEQDPIRPSERITLKLIDEELKSIQREIG